MEPFPPSTIREILAAHHPGYSADDLLAIYAYTGGVAEYVELLMDSGATTKDAMTAMMVAKNSYFIYEGKNMLTEVFRFNLAGGLFTQGIQIMDKMK